MKNQKTMTTEPDKAAALKEQAMKNYIEAASRINPLLPEQCHAKTEEAMAMEVNSSAPPDWRRFFFQATQRERALQRLIEHQGNQIERQANLIGELEDNMEDAKQANMEAHQRTARVVRPLRELFPQECADTELIKEAVRNLKALHRGITVAITALSWEALHGALSGDRARAKESLDVIQSVLPQYFPQTPTPTTTENTNEAK